MWRCCFPLLTRCAGMDDDEVVVPLNNLGPTPTPAADLPSPSTSPPTSPPTARAADHAPPGPLRDGDPAPSGFIPPRPVQRAPLRDLPGAPFPVARSQSLQEQSHAARQNGTQPKTSILRTQSYLAPPSTASVLQRRWGMRSLFGGQSTQARHSRPSALSVPSPHSPAPSSIVSSGRDSVFSSGSDDPSWPVPMARRVESRHLDLSAIHPAELRSLTPEQTQAMGQSFKRLTLPDGCTADTVRAWLKACPALEEITAVDIEGDNRTLSAAQALHLRWFRTMPPGPSNLFLGLQTRALAPEHAVSRPDIARLRGWVAAPDTLPSLTADEFVVVRRRLERYLFEPASRYRSGLVLTPGIQQAAVALMMAAPPELLPHPHAANHASVLRSLQTGLHRCIHYGELTNFLRPTLIACWELVIRPREPSSHALRDREELQAIAALRHWVLSAPPEESEGQRARVANSVLMSAQWSDAAWRSAIITATVARRAPLLEPDAAAAAQP